MRKTSNSNRKTACKIPDQLSWTLPWLSKKKGSLRNSHSEEESKQTPWINVESYIGSWKRRKRTSGKHWGNLHKVWTWVTDGCFRICASRLVKAVVFPVVMYGCESWTIKKAEHWRIDAFDLWCWRRRLRVPWTARRSNQSILKEISPGCSLERLMLKLKLQPFGHLMWRTDSLQKILMLGKLKAGGDGDDRG